MSIDFAATTLTYALTAPDTILNVGDNFSFKYRALYLGSEPPANTMVATRVFLSRDFSFSSDDTILLQYNHTISSALIGADVTASLPFGMAPGRYNLIFQIDPLNQFSETDESNNGQFVYGMAVNRADLTTNSAADVFATHGKLAFMAKLSAAAYHLATYNSIVDEPIIDGINHQNLNVEQYFDEVGLDLTLLDSSDLPSLPRGISGLPVNSNFLISGLRNGIYTNGNAAALLARSTDAIFLAFRGTNDNNGEMGVPFSPSPETPDGDHWFGKDDHFALFEAMLSALATYMQDFGLTKLYVTGHSLGASMVQAYMDSNSSVTIIADTFASPGYGVGAGTDLRVNNIWINGDPITKAAFFSANVGDTNKIYHNLNDQITGLDLRKTNFLGFEVQQSNKEKLGLLHSVTYYVEFTKALQQAGIGEAELTSGALHGIEYDSVFINAFVSGNGATITSVGGGWDTIIGSGASDIILGLNGRDTLRGSLGRDHIVGGEMGDFLYGDQQADFLYGDAGADRLYGGWGRDVLTGGLEADQFVFLHLDYYETPTPGELPPIFPEPNSLSDTITDFQSGLDKINLANIDPSVAAGNQAFTFLGNGAFTGHFGEIRFVYSISGNTLIRGDINGDKLIDFTITLNGLISLQANDFVL